LRLRPTTSRARSPFGSTLAWLGVRVHVTCALGLGGRALALLFRKGFSLPRVRARLAGAMGVLVGGTLLLGGPGAVFLDGALDFRGLVLDPPCLRAPGTRLDASVRGVRSTRADEQRKRQKEDQHDDGDDDGDGHGRVLPRRVDG
jgi:hypothetical protein